ncbi:MAG: hypothetical protein JST81_09950 [Bacteroidetes bacterium]|nr:hypothetical protein [Bacteroidota bacterium]
MKKILLVLSILAGFSANAQQTEDWTAKDEYVKQLGALEKFNVATIADTITRRFADKKDKARAIYYWIANNIALDPKATRAGDNKKILPEEVIQLRKTTPLGFANLFQEMASLATIRCLVVDGFVKYSANDINNKLDEVNHSWNVVQLGQSPETWFYVDVAKASGTLDEKMAVFSKQFTSEYFFADRRLFNLDHYPDNSAWLLGDEKRSEKEFYALPVIGNAAYSYGLQKPSPITGHIKTKTTTPVNFGFIHNAKKTISAITLVMGEGSKQTKSEPMNFTDSDGNLKFSYKFKKADSYPVKVVADGNIVLQYYIDVED